MSELQQSTRTAQLFVETGQCVTVTMLDTGITDQTDLSGATGASTLFPPTKAQIMNLFGGKTP